MIVVMPEYTDPVPRAALDAAWAGLERGGAIVGIDELSPQVSTNRVFRLHVDHGSPVIAKVSSYGSFFLFAEDHDRLYRLHERLAGTRYADFLAPVLAVGDRPYLWYDGASWIAFYAELERRDRLPKILPIDYVRRLGEELATFHQATAQAAAGMPPSSYSLKSNAIHLLDQLASPFAPKNFELRPEQIGTLWRHTHHFLCRLLDVGYDDWAKHPVLVDWNLGNFSVDDASNAEFRMFSRWDYDWFRIESRILDFYFLSRAASSTGDRTVFSYSSHTLTEPRFVEFLRAYHQVSPLSEAELRFIPEIYRFFILNYVVREGARFFRSDLCRKFRSDAANHFLPELDRIDITPLLRILDEPAPRRSRR